MEWINSQKANIMSLEDCEAKRYFVASLNTQRTNVSHMYDLTEGAIVHDTAHLYYESGIKKMIAARGIDLEKSMKNYASGVSGYATTSVDDYVAESFTSYWYNENVIDSELRKVFEDFENGKR